MLTILAAYLRRYVWFLGTAFLCLVPFWLMTVAQLSIQWPSRGMASAVLYALTLSATAVAVRERLLFTLPLSRRQLGRVIWTGAVVVPAAVMGGATLTAAVMAAVFNRIAIDVSWLVASVVYSVAACGALVYLMTVAPGAAASASSTFRNVLWLVAMLAVPMAFAVAVPLPRTAPGSIARLWLVAALAATVAGFYRADRLALAGRRPRARAAPPSATRPDPAASVAAIAHSRGVPVTRWLAVRFVAAAASALATIAVLVAMNQLMPDAAGPAIADSLRHLLGLRSDPSWLSGQFVAIVPLLAATDSGQSLLLRPRWLRTLPFTLNEVTTIVLAGTLATMAGFWVVLFVLVQAVGGGSSAWLQPGAALLLTGLSCWVTAVSFGRDRRPWQPQMLLVVVAFLVAASPAIATLLAPVREPAEWSMGVTLTITAAWWLRHKVRTSHRLYKPVASPFQLSR